MTGTVSTASGEINDDQKLKAKHRAVWASGNYAGLASDLLLTLGPILVQASGVQPGDRVLDVAAGAGNVAIAAASEGAVVVATDLTPELLDVGRQEAQRRGLSLEWREADAEALPFEDGQYDVVLSCVGVMFAPHHQRTADELVRVCRSGGTIGLMNWTPEGFIGQLFGAMKPYAAPPPPGAQPPPLWGNEDHLRALLGRTVTDIELRRQSLRVDIFDSPQAFRNYFKERYGPTIAVYRNIGDDAERAAALDREIDDLVRRAQLSERGTAMNWEYLLLTATKL